MTSAVAASSSGASAERPSPCRPGVIGSLRSSLRRSRHGCSDAGAGAALQPGPDLAHQPDQQRRPAADDDDLRHGADRACCAHRVTASTMQQAGEGEEPVAEVAVHAAVGQARGRPSPTARAAASSGR